MILLILYGKTFRPKQLKLVERTSQIMNGFKIRWCLFKRYGHIKLGMENSWILSADEASSVVNTTGNEIDHNLWGVYQYQW